MANVALAVHWGAGSASMANGAAKPAPSPACSPVSGLVRKRSLAFRAAESGSNCRRAAAANTHSAGESIGTSVPGVADGANNVDSIVETTLLDAGSVSVGCAATGVLASGAMSGDADNTDSGTTSVTVDIVDRLFADGAATSSIRTESFWSDEVGAPVVTVEGLFSDDL